MSRTLRELLLPSLIVRPGKLSLKSIFPPKQANRPEEEEEEEEDVWSTGNKDLG